MLFRVAFAFFPSLHLYSFYFVHFVALEELWAFTMATPEGPVFSSITSGAIVTPSTVQTTITQTLTDSGPTPPPEDTDGNIPTSPSDSSPTIQPDPPTNSPPQSSDTPPPETSLEPDFRTSDTSSSPDSTPTLEFVPILSTPTDSSPSQSITVESTSEFNVAFSTEIIISTRIVASTDSTFGVHTFTDVTTIASFRAVPSQQNNSDTAPAQDHGSSTKTGFIILGVVGGLAVIVVGLLSTWCYLRRKKRRFYDYGTNDYHDTTIGYGTASVNDTSTSTPPSNFGQRFGLGWTMIQAQRNLRRTDTSIGVVPHNSNRVTIASFENSEERIITPIPTPFMEYRTGEVPIQKQNPFADRRVQFHDPQVDEDPFRSDGIVLKPRTRQRNEEDLIVGGTDRPPTYYTTSSTGATVATTLPLYSVHEMDMEMSPIYESRSVGLETPMTDSSLLIPFSYRKKPRRSAKTLSTIGEKF